MRIFILLFWLWVIVVLAILLTQIIIPMTTNNAILPMLRKGRRDAEGNLIKAREAVDIRRTAQAASDTLGVAPTSDEGPKAQSETTAQRRKPNTGKRNT